MNLKNYTSSVPATVTIARIEDGLMRAGADGITKDFDGGRVSSILFHVTLPQGKRLVIRLPANASGVFDTLRAQRGKMTKDGEANLRAQSERTAWKLMQDWVEVQLSLIQMQQAEFLEVFLPYVWTGSQTYFASLKGDKFLALPEATNVR